MVPGDYPSRDSHNDYAYGGVQVYSRSPSPNYRQYSDNRYGSRQPNYTEEWAARREPPPIEEHGRYSYDQEAMRRQYLAVNPHDLRWPCHSHYLTFIIKNGRSHLNGQRVGLTESD